MSEKMPSRDDIEKLLAYLPLFEQRNRQFIKQWNGGEKLENGSITLAYSVFEEDVEHFFRLASEPCWMNSKYNPETAGHMIEDRQYVSKADIESIRTMLTYCVRGERFCDGHWGSVLETGKVVAILLRLEIMLETLYEVPKARKNGRNDF